MRKTALFCIAMMLSAPIAAQQASANDMATQVAEQMAPREQMRGLVLATLSRTTTAAIIVKRVGSDRATALLKAATDKAVIANGDAWASMLADAYRETLTTDELQSARTAFEKRDQIAMMPLTARVGPVMQKKATPLLQLASTDALKFAYEQAMKEPAQ